MTRDRRSSVVAASFIWACGGTPSTPATLPAAPEGVVVADFVASAVVSDTYWDPGICPPPTSLANAWVVTNAAGFEALMYGICGDCVPDTFDWDRESALVGHMCGSSCGAGVELVSAEVRADVLLLDWTRCGSFVCDDVTSAYGVYSVPRAGYPEPSSTYTQVTDTGGEIACR